MRLLAAAALLTALAACSPTVPILQPQAQAKLPDKWPQEWTKNKSALRQPIRHRLPGRTST
jgi:predicted small lipoprotein YifL